MTLSIKGLKIIILGADMYKGAQQETSNIIHIIFEGRKISSVSAKFDIFGNSGPSWISSVCQTFRLDDIILVSPSKVGCSLVHHRSHEIMQKKLFLMSDGHSDSIAIADFGVSDCYPIALRGSTQTLIDSCANLCSTNLIDKRHPTA